MKGKTIGGNSEIGFVFLIGGSGVIMASCIWILSLQRGIAEQLLMECAVYLFVEGVKVSGFLWWRP